MVTTMRDVELRKGGWITTASGRRAYLADPRPQDIEIEDIAHALSHLCHWVGHCQRFLSIAEHSVYVSQQFERAGDALWGLMHDAPEAYLGDVSRPLKAMLPDYKKLEQRWMDAIRDAFRLPASEPPDLKRADNAVLHAEARALMSIQHAVFYADTFGPPADVRIQCLTPERARDLFLGHFALLQKLRAGDAW